MREITIHTSGRALALGKDDSLALLAQIRQAGGKQRDDAEQPLLAAIDTQGADEVTWSEDGKHGALHAIDAWLISEGTTAMPVVMLDLREELMRDLRLPPFDEEIPYDAT